MSTEINIIQNITDSSGDAVGIKIDGGCSNNHSIQHFNLVFSSFIKDRAESFTGRKFIFDAIDSFITDNIGGYFVISGEPGIGKSALMSSLVLERGYVHHFNIATQNITSTKAFSENIVSQLISRYDLASPSWPSESEKNKALSNGAFFNQILMMASDAIEESASLVILIDALDEASTEHASERQNTLCLPECLPNNVYIIATTRPKHDIKLCASSLREFLIDGKSAENIADAREYIEAFFCSRNIKYDGDQLDIITSKSEANFMYLHYILPEIAKGKYILGSIDELPNGLIGYYKSHWRQMKSDKTDFDLHYKPIICVLAAVKEAIDIPKINQFTDIDQSKVIGYIRVSQAHKIINRAVL